MSSGPRLRPPLIRQRTRRSSKIQHCTDSQATLSVNAIEQCERSRIKGVQAIRIIVNPVSVEDVDKSFSELLPRSIQVLPRSGDESKSEWPRSRNRLGFDS